MTEYSSKKFMGGAGVPVGGEIITFNRGPYFEEDGQHYLCEGFYLEKGEYPDAIDTRGINWFPATNGFVYAYTSDNKWFAISRNRECYISENNGQSFSPKSNITVNIVFDYLYFAYFAPINNAWFVSVIGDDGWGYIYRSTNQGATWQQVYGGHNRSHDIKELTDGSIVVACTANSGHGIIMRSTNGGQGWLQTHSTAPVSNGLSSLASGAHGKVIAVGLNLRLVSENFGASWQTLSISAGSFGQTRSISSDNQNIFIISTTSSNLALRSEDGGITWDRLRFPVSSVNDIKLSYAGNDCFLGTNGPEIFRSIDKGLSWGRTWGGSSFIGGQGVATSIVVGGIDNDVAFATSSGYQAIRCASEFGTPDNSVKTNTKRYLRIM